MIGWFRRRRPAPPVNPKPAGWADRHVAHAHGLTLPEWVALPPAQQAELRASVVAALNERHNAA